MSTIEKGSLVLVTGATGFIASHVAYQFLEAGYRVRGTVRDESRAKWLYDLFDAKFGKGKFETALVPDMAADGAFDEAVKGTSGVVHLASIMTFSDKPDEVIPPTVKAALNILTAATQEPGIKSVVYTSSSTAALMPHPNEVIKVSKDTWNEEATKVAYGESPDGFSVYGASKTEAEKAYWKAIEETKPPFQTVAVLPNANFGPTLKAGDAESASTGSWVANLFKGDVSRVLTTPQWFVDVRDTARLHLIALIDPECNGQRIFAFAEPYTMNDILAIMRKQNPGKQLPDDFKDEGKDLSQIPNEDAEALLKKHYGKGFTSLEESIEANTATLK